jgi:hypothetical protein
VPTQFYADVKAYSDFYKAVLLIEAKADKLQSEWSHSDVNISPVRHSLRDGETKAGVVLDLGHEIRSELAIKPGTLGLSHPDVHPDTTPPSTYKDAARISLLVICISINPISEDFFSNCGQHR